MSMVRSLITASAALAVIALTTGAESAKDQGQEVAPQELKAQTLCPVMGGEIDSTYFTDIQGQRVYHCCPACSEKLKADPDKYFKKAAAEGVLFENIQTTCPVSGMALKDKSIFTDYMGRRIAFCGVNCREAFAENPLAYLKKMDEAAPSSEGDKSTEVESTTGGSKTTGCKNIGTGCSHQGCGHGL